MMIEERRHRAGEGLAIVRKRRSRSRSRARGEKVIIVNR